MCIELLPRQNEYLIIRKTGSNEEVKEFLNDYSENRDKHFNFNLEETMVSRTLVNDYYNEFVLRIHDQHLDKYYDKVIIYYSSDGNPINPIELNQAIEHDNNIALVVINYDHPLSNLPNTIKSLLILMNQNIHRDGKTHNYGHPLDNLPINLEILSLSACIKGSIDLLPIGLLRLDLNYSCWVSLDNLPNTLYCLILNSRNDIPMFNLPRSLKVLMLSEDYQNELKNLPELKELYVGSDYYRPLIDLPDSLEELTISGNPSEVVLPNNLKTLEITYECYTIPKWLPDTIKKINVTEYMDNVNNLFDLLDEYIPYNLKEININPFLHEVILNSNQLEFIRWLEENNITVNINKI